MWPSAVLVQLLQDFMHSEMLFCSAGCKVWLFELPQPSLQLEAVCLFYSDLFHQQHKKKEIHFLWKCPNLCNIQKSLFGTNQYAMAEVTEITCALNRLKMTFSAASITIYQFFNEIYILLQNFRQDPKRTKPNGI